MLVWYLPSWLYLLWNVTFKWDTRRQVEYIYYIHQCLSPKLVWQLCMREYGCDPLCECPIHSLCKTILMRCLRYFLLLMNTIYSVVSFKRSSVLTTIVLSNAFQFLFSFSFNLGMKLLESIQHLIFVFQDICKKILEWSSINVTKYKASLREFSVIEQISICTKSIISFVQYRLGSEGSLDHGT